MGLQKLVKMINSPCLITWLLMFKLKELGDWHWSMRVELEQTVSLFVN